MQLATLAAPTNLAALPAEARDRKIIALCDDAIGSLNEARDLEDVLGIRDAAEAFATYTRKWRAAAEAQNQCKLVVLLAEARIGAELKAAQERGEVASAGDNPNVRASDNQAATLPQIGIPRQRAAEFKAMAEAGEEVIREEVTEATAEKRRPSRSRIVEKAKRKPSPRKHITAAIPTIAQRPPEFSRFSLWLSSGAALVTALPEPAAFRAAMAGHAMRIPPGEVAAVLSFLTALQGDEA